MKLEKPALIAEIIGALAVVDSLIYVGVSIRILVTCHCYDRVT
jgi:hypothetical protein